MQFLASIGAQFVRAGAERPRLTPTLLGFVFALCAIFCCAALPSISAKAGKSKTAPPDLTPSALSRQAWAILDEGAASHSLRKRTDAIAALSSMQGDDKAIKLIENGLVDKNLDVRRIAASALGNMDAKEALPALKKATDDPDPTVSFAAAEALWKMGDRSGAEIFYAVVLGNRHAAHGAVSSNIDDAKKTLHDPKALALIGINEGSGALLGPFSESITIAEVLAKDRSSSSRALSATLLGQHPTPDAEKILEDALADKNIAVRAAAARALGGFDDPALIKRLAPLMGAKGTPLIKPVDSVRYMASAAVLRLLRKQKSAAPATTASAKSGR
ncbi:MAG: HEAT repeat domain-containing protein [Candidatus Acidiferrales bacterium]